MSWLFFSPSFAPSHASKEFALADNCGQRPHSGCILQFPQETCLCVPFKLQKPPSAPKPEKIEAKATEEAIPIDMKDEL